MIRAAKLDRRIAFERETKTIDRHRRATVAWREFASVRAEIVTASTDELARPFGEEAKSATVFRIRYLGGITTADRITYDGRAFNIREIVEIGRRRGYEIRAEAVQ